MKKLVSLLTVLMLSLQMTTAFAAGATATVGSATGAPGETVEVDIVLANCIPWANLALEISYDTNALTLVGATPAIANTASPTFDRMPYKMLWESSTADKDYNGKLVTLQFKIAETAADGSYAIDLDYMDSKEGYYDGEDYNYNLSWEPLNLTYVDGSITVAKPAPAGPTMNATKSGSTVSIVATPDGESFSGKFIVAGYDAEGLVAVEVLDAAATATATINADTVKVMWWDSLTGLNSIVPADTDMDK